LTAKKESLPKKLQPSQPAARNALAQIFLMNYIHKVKCKKLPKIQMIKVTYANDGTCQ